jgi:hypothetical protein
VLEKCRKFFLVKFNAENRYKHDQLSVRRPGVAPRSSSVVLPPDPWRTVASARDHAETILMIRGRFLRQGPSTKVPYYAFGF